ncbi:MAG TPA: hypothetical protein VFN10_02185 [Thermoanaerobaculia bacterium]|nr:hypothetical protein [Thermoanaerobaculia bacterium]
MLPLPPGEPPSPGSSALGPPDEPEPVEVVPQRGARNVPRVTFQMPGDETNVTLPLPSLASETVVSLVFSSSSPQWLYASAM